MYKKIFMFILVIFSTFFMINTTNVEAYNGEVRYELTSYNSPEEKKDCESLFGDPKEDGTVANFLQQIFTIMGYAAPVLCTDPPWPKRCSRCLCAAQHTGSRSQP